MQAPVVIYSNDLVKSEDMKETDRDYGVIERRAQNFTIDYTAKTILYYQDDYYSHKNGKLQEKITKRQTTLHGTFITESDKIVAEVQGNYLSKQKDYGKLQTNDEKKGVIGTLTLQKTVGGGEMSIIAVQLKENGYAFNSYFNQFISSGLKFKAIKNI